MRFLRFGLIVIATAGLGLYLWSRLRIPCLVPPSVRAQESRRKAVENPPPLTPNQASPKQAPPFSHFANVQPRWDYSDLVCTGTADEPQRTGVVKRIGGEDRDQLISWVRIETCFKGKAEGTLRVLGYDAFAKKDITQGYIYAGPPTGFVQQGRNLLFLRKSTDPQTWDVTVPVVATCIPLAQTAPDYTLDGSANSIRNALASEMSAVIMSRGHGVHEYLDYILQFLGEHKGLQELKRLSATANHDLRREVSLTLLWHHDQSGEDEALSLLNDSNAPAWQRANAARALRNATSKRALRAVREALNQPVEDELRNAAQESLSYMQR